MARRTKILYSVAKDSHDQLMNANDAEKGPVYRCPQCETSMLLRKSGKTGPGSRRPHFAHKALTPNCTPESTLHLLFKQLAAEQLRAWQGCKNNEDRITWTCDYCGDEHSHHLTAGIGEIHTEYDLSVCRPDILAINTLGHPDTAVEIVVTHAPEDPVLEYYRKAHIKCFEIQLDDDRDLLQVADKLRNPTRIHHCQNPTCWRCGHYMAFRILHIIDGACWKCHQPMKVAAVTGSTRGILDNQGTTSGPDSFSGQEIRIAREQGVLIEQHYSRTMSQQYPASTCDHCRAFVGSHYLMTDYLAPAMYGDLPSQQIRSNNYCSHCIEKEMMRG